MKNSKSAVLIKKHKKTIFISAAIIAFALVSVQLFYYFNIIPHKKYDNGHFGIKTYISQVDKDGDGIDDQTDILQGVRAYIATEPVYKSKYYGETGWPDDGYGVCTDVVARGLLAAGYDLMELVSEDVALHRERYGDDIGDKMIAFRRVRNLIPYFEGNAIKLTDDITDISEWQGGDIVIFPGHIGIISDKRNSKGIPFVIHHANPFQREYEEDVLEKYDEIVGHYRVS